MRSGRQEDALTAYRESRRLAELAGEEAARIESPLLAALHGPLPIDRCIVDAELVVAHASHQLPEAFARLGLAYAMAGREPEARAALERAIARFREVGGEFRLADGYAHLGYALLFAGDAAGAADALGAAAGSLERTQQAR